MLNALAQHNLPVAGNIQEPVSNETGSTGVLRLNLTNFRSYSSLKIETDLRPVVLTGSNGAGKTNVLEALSFLIPGRGLRRAKLTDIVKISDNACAVYGRSLWGVAADVQTPEETVKIGTGCEYKHSPEKSSYERRIVKINGEQTKNQADLGNYLTAIWLTPTMDRLFQGSPSSRMRFLDRLVYAFDPEHAKRTSAYTQAMKQRSKLLKEGVNDNTWLSVLEETMSCQAIAVAAARRETVARLVNVMEESSGPFPAAEIDLDGAVEQWLEEMPALKAEDKLREILARQRYNDAIRGSASEGTHKTDLKVWHKEKNMPANLCSTGEQKALLIAMILAQTRAQTAVHGRTPVLLLDEIVAHLDKNRRKKLFDEICALKSQTWLTGTDVNLFKELEDRAQFLHVSDSTITNNKYIN